MLASDDNNPNFVGAFNPDSRLAVRFYCEPKPNEFESKKQGRPIFFDCDMVRIEVPGDKLSVIDTFVNDSHKQRFPMHWARYQNNKGSEEQHIGTPLSQWPLVSRSQAEELKALKFHTVENIAQASDLQLQNINMIAGMSPFAFRERAKNFLSMARDSSILDQSKADMQALADENAATKKALADMQAQMLELLANQKAKPGPKPKLTEDA